MPEENNLKWNEEFPAKTPAEGDDYNPTAAGQTQNAAAETREVLQALIDTLAPFEDRQFVDAEGRRFLGLLQDLQTGEDVGTHLPLEIYVSKPAGAGSFSLYVYPSVLQGYFSATENPKNVTPTLGGTAIDDATPPASALSGQSDGVVQNVEIRLTWTSAGVGEYQKKIGAATIHVLGAGVAFTVGSTNLMVVQLGKITWLNQVPTAMNWVIGSPHYCWPEGAAMGSTYIPPFWPSTSGLTLTFNKGFVYCNDDALGSYGPASVGAANDPVNADAHEIPWNNHKDIVPATVSKLGTAIDAGGSLTLTPSATNWVYLRFEVLPMYHRVGVSTVLTG